MRTIPEGHDLRVASWHLLASWLCLSKLVAPLPDPESNESQEQQGEKRVAVVSFSTFLQFSLWAEFCLLVSTTTTATGTPSQAVSTEIQVSEIKNYA